MRHKPLAQETAEMRDRPIVARCENWGKCLRLYVPGWSAPQPICGDLSSAESQWRSGFRVTPGPNPTVGLDIHDAKVVESAVQILPLYEHLLLKGWYVRSNSPGKCLAQAAKEAGVTKAGFGRFDVELERAHVNLLAALLLPAVVRKLRARALVHEALGITLATAEP